MLSARRTTPAHFLLAAAALATAHNAASAPQETPSLPAKLLPLKGELALPVVDGAIVHMGKRAALLGGMTEDFKATPAVQLRTPDGTWKPVGNQLLEARIGPSVIALPDNRVFVWGGFGGSAAGELTPLHNGEVLDPRVAGSSRLITPPEGAAWETPSAPVLLDDGSVGLIAANALYRFDLQNNRWEEPLPLGRRLAGPSLCTAPKNRLLACGVDPKNESTHVIEIDLATETITPWEDHLPERILGGQLIRMPDGLAVLMGWPQADGRPSRRTVVLSPETRTMTNGPTLPLVGSGPSWQATCRVGPGIVVMMTVRKEPDTKDHSVAFYLQYVRGTTFRVWRLAQIPPGRRQMLLAHGSKAVELIGGYEFLPSGPKITRTSALLEYGTGPIGD